MARPTKLTPELQEKIVKAVKAGNYIETAAAFAGISKQTLYDWMKRGNDATRGAYREFLDAMEKALAEAEMFDVYQITRAAQAGNWQAAAWRLERKFPTKYGHARKHDAEMVEIERQKLEIMKQRAGIGTNSDAVPTYYDDLGEPDDVSDNSET